MVEMHINNVLDYFTMYLRTYLHSHHNDIDLRTGILIVLREYNYYIHVL